ncbi:MAG TPA: hypothetical protein DHV36_10765 [Desulfobacteraceae bacterium]|nr:hypothetical protein [Desulfobacteraceae bacterium]
MTFIYLSHVLEESTPAYGNGPSLKREAGNRMANGDSCNTEAWHLSNHIGTHIDAPRHFCRDGAVLDTYPADFWCCRKVFLLDVADVAPGEIIGTSRLALDEVPADTELLLMRTGIEKRRSDMVYMMENPGFSPDLAAALRDKLPLLRMIGFDGISLSSFASRPLGRKAHKAFLDHDRPILIIEDMALADALPENGIREAMVCPLRVRDSDAAPCTVIARI